MLDVEFLLGDQTIDRPLVYSYRSGVLRAALIQAFRQQHERSYEMRDAWDYEPRLDTVSLAKGEKRWKRLSAAVVQAESLHSLLQYDSVFFPPPPGVCDWAVLEGEAQAKLPILLNLLTNSRSPFIFLTPHKGKPTQEAIWPEIKRRCVFLEEPTVNSDTLLPILRYLEATTDLVNKHGLSAQTEFVASFDRVIFGGKADLSTAIQAFEERVLLATDPKDHRFQLSRWTVEAESLDAPSALEQLRRFLTRQTIEAWVGFYVAFAHRLRTRRWSTEEAMGELYRVSTFVLEGLVRSSASRDYWDFKSENPASTFRDLDVGIDSTSVIWSALILAQETQLLESLRKDDGALHRIPDPFLVVLDQLGRDYLTRVASKNKVDPLRDLWLPLRERLSPWITYARSEDEIDLSTTLDRRRLRFVKQLFAHVQSADSLSDLLWMKRLSLEFVEEGAEAGPLNNLPSTAAECSLSRDEEALRMPRLQRFEDVLGQPLVVAKLLGLVLDRKKKIEAGQVWQPDRGLILHGPKGVGKGSLADLFMRAMRCQDPSKDGSPCHTCLACRDAELHGSGFNWSFFDARIGDVSFFRRVGELDSAGSLSDQQRCAFIWNLDLAKPAAVDAILKKLENLEQTLFVFSAVNLADVRPAIQSRCRSLRIRPLAATESKKLITRFLPQVRNLEEDALDTLIVAGGGLPSQLHSLSVVLHSEKSLDLETVRSKLHLNWVPELLRNWVNKLRSDDDGSLLAFKESVSRDAEYVRRTRMWLGFMFSRATISDAQQSETMEPALIHHPSSIWRELDAAAEVRAAQLQMSVSELWRLLCRVWLSGDRDVPAKVDVLTPF